MTGIRAHLITRASKNILVVAGDLPHYRQDLAVIQRLRDSIYAQLKESKKAPLPITAPIELHLYPSRSGGGDLSNIVQAVCQALDGHTLKAPAPLESDGLIATILAEWAEQ